MWFILGFWAAAAAAAGAIRAKIAAAGPCAGGTVWLLLPGTLTQQPQLTQCVTGSRSYRRGVHLSSPPHELMCFQHPAFVLTDCAAVAWTVHLSSPLVRAGGWLGLVSHFWSMFWKLCCATTPPAWWLGGWPCFWASLAWIIALVSHCHPHTCDSVAGGARVACWLTLNAAAQLGMSRLCFRLCLCVWHHLRCSIQKKTTDIHTHTGSACGAAVCHCLLLLPLCAGGCA